ncbi:MAG: filamentous hemagglutinin N-terminal domain-containing protein, partial [Sphingobium sp.]
MITRSFRQKLLISASLSAMLMTGVAEARSGRVFSGRGGADPAAAAARAAQEQATRTTETNSASKRAIETFRRAAETRRAAMDAQIQARALARAAQNLVPNGLKPGGLQVAAEIDPSLWVGANGPVESAGEGGRTSVTVEQTEQKAILNWDSFNVGRETDLKFNQGGSDWVVLNRVHDATASQIHGTINAPGTVLILNQNGILFGGTSQVNVRNLVASAATITDTQFHEYGLYSSGTTGAGNNTLHISSFTEALGSIMVEAGAQISTIKPASVVEGGGYVLLMGTDVTNEGTITTPRGQALMAAGKDFAVRAGQGTDVNQWATTRGNELIVNVEGGTVVNRGVIEAAEGDITLVGKHVEQDGVAVATTTVNTRGTIHLLTDLSDSEATITLAGDSLTLVVPDYDSDTTATDAQRDAAVGDIMVSVASFPGWNNSNLGNLLYTLPDRKDLSRIDIRTGGTVDFQSESQTIATGGQVAIVGLKRVFVADGAQIDVSGSSGVALSMESNSLLVNVQPYEMRDSPLNREGEHLKSTDIWIDVRSLVLMPDGTGGYDGDRYYTGNGFLEVGGHLGNVERGIGEWTAQGGTITINSAEIVAQKGAIFDISGGSIDYQAGLIRSTRVMGADGKLYDISNVPANIEVVAYGDAFVRKHERWGEAYTQVWSNPLFSGRSTMRWQDGYSVGRDAGVLTLRAPTVVFEGEIIADVITGERQIAERPGYPDPVDFPQLPQRIDGYKLPQDVAPLAGQLFVGRGGFTGILTNNEVIQVPLESTVVIGAGTDVAGSIDATTALSEDLLNRVEFSAADLNRFGLGELRVLTTGSITIDEALSVKNGGQMRLRAQDFDVRADLTARSGVIAMFGTQDGDESMTSVRIGGGVMLDTSGLWVNLPKGGNAADLAHLDGGDIYIASNQGDITLGAGSLLDASAGGAILLDNRIKGADGGDVTLTVNDVPAGTHNRVVLDGMIQSYGSEDGVGGTLTLTTSDGVELGDTMLTEHGMLGADERAPFMLHLSEDTVLPAGMVLPSDITIVKRRIAPGEIVAVNTSVGIYHNATGGLVFTEEWTVPTGLTVTNFDGVSYRAGAVVPVGTDVRTITGTLPAGSPLPELLYPFGMTIAAPVSVHYAAGTILTEDLTVPAGTRIDRGNGLGVAANVHETLVLEQDFFQQGFSQYTIRSFADIVMAEDATIDVAAPVRRVTPDSAGVASGANLGDAMELWLPEMFREDAANGRFIQRAGAGISLTASNQRPGTNLPPPAGSLFIGKDAALRVDDGQSIALHAYDSMLVEGRLDAHGGNIALEALGAPPISTSTTTYDASKALWLGDGAVLDVSGRAHEAVDRFGRRYADVSAGGAVSLSGGGGSFVITEAGALIDISGASAEIDYATRGIPGGTGTTLLASNGGSLALSSRRGIVLDAQLRAHAGGEGAIGGLLSIDQQSLGLAFGANMPAFLMPDHIRVLGKVVLDAAHIGSDLDDIAFGDCIAGCWTPGQTLEEAAAANAGKPDLLLQARIGADKIEDSGFGSLTMSTDDVILLNGAVDLTLAGTLTLQGIVAAADGDLTGALPAEDDTSGATNTDNDSILRAGYVYINGNGGNLRSTRLHPTLAREPGGKNSLDGPPTIGAGTLTIEGNLLDVGHGRFGVNGAIVRNAPDPLMPFEYAEWNTVHLSSSGDFRLIGGDIKTGGNLTLTAAQIYPVTNATAGLFAGVLGYQRPGQTASYSTILPGSVLTINGIEGATPAAPLSLYGRLTLSADIIEQGGIIRAPMGKIVLGSGGSTQWNSALPVLKEDGTYDYTGPHVATSEVNLLPGSVTSVSAAGLVLPYGGTVDGTSWVRKDVNDLPAEDGAVDTTLAHQGIAIVGSLRADEGSVLDLSGGGTVAGAGFIPGRGGSIDVLSNPLYDISPAYRGLSSPDNKVYALVPSYGASTAPVPEAGRNQPGAGQQIIVPEGVAGLPAGAYTLLPGEYALLPGAFRVELGAAVSPGAAVSRLADGSFFAAVGSANALTGERSGQPLAAILTPADVVRTFAQYNEMDLATYFAQAPRASLFDNPLPSLPQDGKQLLLAVTPQKDGSDRPLLSFNGTGLFGAGENGRGGSVAVVKGVGSTAFDGGLEIVADGALATEGFIAINASDLNAIGASLMTIGGEMDPAFVLPGYQPILNIRAGGGTLPQVQTTGAAGSYTIDSTGFTTVAVRDGAVLEAPQVMLIAGTNNHVVVDAGARISSIGMGAPAYDASSGYFGQTGANVLAVSNGMLDITTSAVTTSAGSITVADGASLHSEGALAFVSNGAVKLSGEADYGGRYINLSTGNFNIGGSEALTDAETQGILPSGITLNQSVIERLMAGSTASGVPAAERLILTASQQINFYGSVDMDAGSGADGKSLQLVLNAPALYGHGGDGDAVSISAGTLVWNGIVTQSGSSASASYGSIQPGAPIAGGPGYGTGTLNLVADTLVLGYQDGVAVYHNETLDRLALGFSAVNLIASEQIISGEKGSLSVWQSQAVHGEAGTGGTLNLVAPVVTGKAGSVFSYRTGGELTLRAPEGAAPVANMEAALGAEIRLNAASIAADTAIALPSGRLVMTATEGDITLGDGAVLDMAGRATEFFDQTRYSWGGDVVLESAHGDVSLAEGAAIELGAQHNHAGMLKVTAVEGAVTLAGVINGHATGAEDEPDPELRNSSIDIRAGSIADFTNLNTRLTDSGVTDTRSFIIKTGDLVIGDEMVARNVTVSADGGSLTVNGRIDASGAKPGTIRLSARDDLTLASSAVLDASADTLWVDSYGAPVEASNRGFVELTSAGGTLALQQGATIDLSSADDVARGQVELNAQRVGADDVAIAAAQTLTITGADSISVNAFRTYEPENGIINQALMDGIHAESEAFINAAIGNGALLGRMAGLTAYADAFHLRPGVELVSAPDESLSVSGDLNLADYRYASLNADTQRTGEYGSGEPGVLLVRASDDLNIFGSITDGFAEPARTPDDNGWVIYAGLQNVTTNTFPADYHVPSAMRIG